MFDEGLKTSFWVAAEIARCDRNFLPMTVLYRGDDSRGLVLVKQYIAGQGCVLHGLMRNMNGRLDWHKPLGMDPVEEVKTDEYIARQRKYDEDLWVLEVEDPKGLYSPLC